MENFGGTRWAVEYAGPVFLYQYRWSPCFHGLLSARALPALPCSARRCSPPAAPTTIADASHHAGSFALGGRHREGRTCCWWQADLQGDIARCQWHGIEGRWLRVDVVGSGRGHRAATDKAPAASVMATAAAPVGISPPLRRLPPAGPTSQQRRRSPMGAVSSV